VRFLLRHGLLPRLALAARDVSATGASDRLAERDRAVLADDVVRLKEFQDQHNRPH